MMTCVFHQSLSQKQIKTKETKKTLWGVTPTQNHTTKAKKVLLLFSKKGVVTHLQIQREPIAKESNQ